MCWAQHSADAPARVPCVLLREPPPSCAQRRPFLSRQGRDAPITWSVSPPKGGGCHRARNPRRPCLPMGSKQSAQSRSTDDLRQPVPCSAEQLECGFRDKGVCGKKPDLLKCWDRAAALPLYYVSTLKAPPLAANFGANRPHHPPTNTKIHKPLGETENLSFRLR